MSALKNELAPLERPGSPAAGLAIPPPAIDWRTRLFVPGLILGLAVFILVFTGWRSLVSATPVQVVPVVSKGQSGLPRDVGPGASPGSGHAAVQAPGWIEPDPFPAYVPALAEGVVSEVLVLEGQRVEAGQTVARLIDADARLTLARADAELSLADTEVESARAELQAAQAEWDNPVERTRAIAVAQAAAAETRADLARHDAEVLAEQAEVQEVRDEHDRLSKSSELLAAASGEFARVKLRLAAKEQAVQATMSHRAVLEATLLQRQADLAAATEAFRLRISERKALDSAKAALRRAESHLAQDKAMRDEAALRLSRMEVTSPVSGIVMMRMVDPGSRIMLISDDPHASHIARLYDPAKLQVRVDIPLAEASRVGIGQRAEITTEAVPDQVFRGVVTRRVDEANIQKNTVQVKVSIESPSSILRPEMLARVKFFGADLGGAVGAVPSSGTRLFAPRGALLETAGGVCAWVVDRRTERATLRRVTVTGAAIDDWVEVADGLRLGDRIIMTGLDRLSEGERVRVLGEFVAGEDNPTPPAPHGGHGS
jgi:RND family efflux transporter MFP subunit